MTEDEKRTIAQFTGETPVRVGALATALGLEVLKDALKPQISGLIEPSESAPAGFRIRVNRFETPERQRFTIAHEIAHYLLHRDYIGRGIYDSILYRSNLSSRREVEANRLAADLIMPLASVARELAGLGGARDDMTATVLAEKFRVSLPAMKIRIGA